MIEEFEKQCTCCYEVRPLSAFYARPSKPYLTYNDCKRCHDFKTKQWKRDNPDRSRELQQKASRKYSQVHRSDPCWLEKKRQYYQKRKAQNTDSNRADYRKQQRLMRARDVWAVLTRHPNASIRQLQSMLGWSSTSVVNHYISVLIDMGYVEKDAKHKSRALRVVVPFVVCEATS